MDWIGESRCSCLASVFLNELYSQEKEIEKESFDPFNEMDYAAQRMIHTEYDGIES